MKRTTLLVVLLCLGNLVQFANLFAEEFRYPAKNPLVSITFPDSWKIQPDEDSELLHAYPKDESLYFGFIPLPTGADDDKVAEALGGIIDEMVTDLEERGEPEVFDVNNVKLVITDAVGKEKESGEAMNVSLVHFSPDDNPDHMMAVVYFGTAEAEKKHEKAITSIIQSIKNPNK